MIVWSGCVLGGSVSAGGAASRCSVDDPKRNRVLRDGSARGRANANGYVHCYAHDVRLQTL